MTTVSAGGDGTARRELAGELGRLFSQLAKIGRDPAGGVTRVAWSLEDQALRRWFHEQAAAREMPSEQDRNGNLWAWWGPRGPGAVVTGSHLDSVPNGGAFDGPLGVISAFLAIDELRSRGVEPVRPVAVACFSDEEGARFGVACVGSRLMTGVLAPDAARALTDVHGITLAKAMQDAGARPAELGAEPERLAEIASFVELHVEQGRALVDLDAPLGLATAIWPHGRWRCTFRGEANHAGTTRLEDRHDPVLAFARTAIAARAAAESHAARATFGRVVVHPNATNAVAARLDAWLDGRAGDESSLSALVEEIATEGARACTDHGIDLEIVPESRSGIVELAGALRDRLSATLGGVPALATAAGHDAGILAAHVPTAMVFVRNPTGVSHSPAEHATVDDCCAGVVALARVLDDLASS